MPFRDQAQLPNFTTAERDFNFAQIFTREPLRRRRPRRRREPAHARAHDRASIESETGLERLSAALGPGLLLQPPRVTLSGTPTRRRKTSDLLALRLEPGDAVVRAGRRAGSTRPTSRARRSSTSPRATRPSRAASSTRPTATHAARRPRTAVAGSSRSTSRPSGRSCATSTGAGALELEPPGQASCSRGWRASSIMRAAGRSARWRTASSRRRSRYSTSFQIQLELSGPLEDRHQSAGDPAAEHFRLPPVRRDSAHDVRTPASALRAALARRARRRRRARASRPPAARLDTRLATPPSRVVPVDRIVAVVNDEVITQNDLNERVRARDRASCSARAAQLPLGRRAPAPDPRAHDQRPGAGAAGEGERHQGRRRHARQDHRSASPRRTTCRMTDFRAALERDGIRYARFREDIRNEILLTRLREREVENAVVVTDAEVETELAREAQGAPRRLRVPARAHPGAGAAAGRRPSRSSSAAAARCRRSRSCARARTSRRSRRPIPTRPTPCRAATSAGAPSGRLPTLFLETLESCSPAR